MEVFEETIDSDEFKAASKAWTQSTAVAELPKQLLIAATALKDAKLDALEAAYNIYEANQATAGVA